MGTTAFWVGSTACQCLCSLCQVCGATEKVFARIGYVLQAFFWIIISVLLLYFGHYLLDNFFTRGYFECEGAAPNVCLGISAVYRTSFALAIFHGLFTMLCLCENELVNKLNEGAWPIKVCFLIVVFCLSLFIPNGFFRIYGYIATVPSFLFIVYEMILIIDLAYSWNMKWAGNLLDEGTGDVSKCWFAILTLFTIIFFGAGLFIHVLLFLYKSTSTVDYVIISLPIVAALVYTVLSKSPLVEAGSIFTCSLMFFFSSFMTASVMFSDPTQSSPGILLMQIVIGLGFMFFVLFYLGAQTVKPPVEVTSTEKKKPPAQQIASSAVNALAENAESEGHEVLKSDDSGERAPKVTLKTAMFHLLMMAAAVYYSMVITNWGAPKTEGEVSPEGFSNPWVGYGVMLADQWIGILFFVWSLIAPRVCTGRTFHAVSQTLKPEPYL